MSKLFLMCGIPGSGKTTWLKNNVNDKFGTVFSRDAIRFSLLKDGNEYFSKEKEVYDILIENINNSLQYDLDVFVDATHLNPVSRTKLLRRLDLSNTIEVNAIVMDTPLSVCLKRNAQREGRARVPEDVIKDMALNYSVPTEEEGFNNIYFVKS